MPELISLSEAVILVKKNESTIRRFFKKPQNKPHTQTKDGKVYIDKAVLLKQYPAPESTPESPELTPEQTPESPEQTPGHVSAELVELLKAQIEDLKKDKALLREQLEIKDRQLARADERTNYLLLQANPQPAEQAEGSAPEPPQEKRRSWWARTFRS